MLCIINEALYAFQVITPVQTDNIKCLCKCFLVSVKWELPDCCERQVGMDWLIFKLKCSGAVRR